MFSSILESHRRCGNHLQDSKVNQQEEDKKKVENVKLTMEIEKLEEQMKMLKTHGLK